MQRKKCPGANSADFRGLEKQFRLKSNLEIGLAKVKSLQRIPYVFQVFFVKKSRVMSCFRSKSNFQSNLVFVLNAVKMNHEKGKKQVDT